MTALLARCMARRRRARPPSAPGADARTRGTSPLGPPARRRPNSTPSTTASTWRSRACARCAPAARWRTLGLSRALSDAHSDDDDARVRAAEEELAAYAAAAALPRRAEDMNDYERERAARMAGHQQITNAGQLLPQPAAPSASSSLSPPTMTSSTT